jgi:hypothetical protein
VTGASDQRSLATRLANTEVPALAALLQRRGVTPSAAWHDAFDAAEGLLDAASVDRALATLPRRLLVALASAADIAEAVDADSASFATAKIRSAHEELVGLGLVRAGGAPYAIVSARVRAARDARPDAFILDASAAGRESNGPTSPTPSEEAAIAERIVGSVAALADLLLLGVEHPVTTTAARAVSATDRRRLIDAHVVGDAAELDDLLALADQAGLLRLADREWRLTERGSAWLPTSTLHRWGVVATAFVRALPAALCGYDSGRDDSGPDDSGRDKAVVMSPSAWATARPLDPEWPPRAATLLAQAVRWGMLSRDTISTPHGGSQPDEEWRTPGWALPLWRGDGPNEAALASVLPAEIDVIYLQADLTAIAPGPLRPALELRLRGMAARESRAQASTYRFTEESLTSAVSTGETAASLREFLGELSLSGIPQPLDYLIERVAARHGLVQVRTDVETGRTAVESADAHVLRTIAVDQSLRSLGLTENGSGLVSRVSREAVYWTLADARYPVVALDDDGARDPVHRRRAPIATQEASDPAAALVPLATRIHASGDGTATSWLERELDQAVRARATVRVSVRLPDASTREFTLEATGLGGGRLRGRDRAADIERTLPLSSIIGVRPE